MEFGAEELETEQKGQNC